jgi:hypothetical protein
VVSSRNPLPFPILHGSFPGELAAIAAAAIWARIVDGDDNLCQRISAIRNPNIGLKLPAHKPSQFNSIFVHDLELV